MATTLKNKLLIVIIALGLSSCLDIEDNYTMPNWDTELNIPIANREYLLEEIANKSENISIDTTNGSNQYILHTDTMYSKYALSDYLSDKIKYDQDFKEIVFTDFEVSIPFEFPENIELDSADFIAGSIVFEAENLTSNEIDAQIEFPNFQKNGNVIQRQVKINPTSSSNETIDLAGTHYSGSASIDKKYFMLRIKYSGEQLQKIKYRLRIINTECSYVSGLFPSKELGLLASNVKIDLEEKYGQFRDKFSTSASELLIIGNYISDLSDVFDLQIQDAKVIGKYNNLSKELKKDGLDNLGDFFILNGKLNERITSSNSNLGEFLAFLPKDIDFNSQLIMNPDSKRGSARITDSIELKMVFSVMGKISAQDIEFSDTLEFAPDSDEREIIQDANYATLFLNVDNGIPLGTKVKCSFTDDNYKELFRKEFTVDAGKTDNEGKSSESVKTELIINLDKEEVNYLSQTKMIVITLILSTDENKEIVLRSMDKLHITAFCKLNYRVNFE